MDGSAHRWPAAARSTSTGKLDVQTELFEHVPGATKMGFGGQPMPANTSRWDPYDRFSKKEELGKFFSGHKYRPHSLIDREKFARFAIKETLRWHPEDSFKTTGEIMNNEFVTDQPKAANGLDGLAREIRADGQRDVDNEAPSDHSADTNAKKMVSSQKISAAAQSVIAASANSLGPPVSPCAEYLNMTSCGQYNCSDSTIWKSPLIPTLDNEDGRRGLLDHQITAIVWLLSRMFGALPILKNPDTDCFFEAQNRDRLKGPKYFGGILADSMGLGKTLTIVALIDLLMRQKLNCERDANGKVRHRPILLVIPNATVANQWIQEFLNVIDKSVLHQIVVSGPGLEAQSDSERVTHLARESFKSWPATLNYMWDEDDSRASRIVLIVTMETWANRTCFQKEYEREIDDKVVKEWTSSFTDTGRGFSLVIVDEAHKVKNPGTKNWRSIYFLKRQFTLLITATPCMNTLSDLFGLARLLWTAAEHYLCQDSYTVDDNIDETIDSLEDLQKLDDCPSDHDFQLVAGRPGLLAKLLFKPRKARTADINLTRQYLKYFERLAMLKRSPSSYLYFDWEGSKQISLEGLFPKVENYTVDIGTAEAYSHKYQMVHIDHLINYLECLVDWRKKGVEDDEMGTNEIKKESKKKSKKIIKKEEEEEEKVKHHLNHELRLLQLASSSLDIYHLDTILMAEGYSTLAPRVADMRDRGINILHLAQFLIPENETRPDTHISWMKLITQNSPVLRYILHYINENILTRYGNEPMKKLLIIEENVMIAFYYELALQFLGLECRCMHARLTLEERQELVDSFNSSRKDSCQILIQLYSVGFAGTNLHKSCSRVLVASQSHSLQVQWQTIHRVIRVGQTSDVTVHRVKLQNSYHNFRESRQIEKILPELGARAQGSTKIVLVRLLNLFQYEIRNAWDSPEGQKLLKEKNLLEDDKDHVVTGEPPAKKIKIDDRTQYYKTEMKYFKKEDTGMSYMNNFMNMFTPESAAKKRGQKAIEPKPGDGSGGWYNLEASDISDTDSNSSSSESDNTSRAHHKLREESDTKAFLQLRTRNDYYEEFVSLPRESKSRFSHVKNDLRRLLSYGNDDGNLATAPWNENDLEDPAVLERALELMLRVRLGTNDIPMLPFPMIDLSGAYAPRRKLLQRLLGEVMCTDQQIDTPTPVAALKDIKEPLRGLEVDKSPTEIEKDLENIAKRGDLGSKKMVMAKASPGPAVDTALDDDGVSESDEYAGDSDDEIAFISKKEVMGKRN
ncbi:P-loop containing nucleoside triphosphate hydrolase protein [Astrocystis sublimbata]|nr:P-loop containing nucleoside triphosphate hydrolase protein [Astrocystis sublimbata]